ncbi:hypothetical protein [Mesorhizobium sp. B263B2A]|uniref:hypothetical protein n=1 Tax=Mesorhizobium sp. B263B2A TaxID=2876669 RepID=UPI001CD10030|nr:hypothetical protein [Mesorhizobium sp. B263B2A]MCA0034450.1 hypothetical protein [Mesorhizobium sp. B263B2A]
MPKGCATEATVNVLGIAPSFVTKIGSKTGKKQIETVAHSRVDPAKRYQPLQNQKMFFKPRFPTALWTLDGIGLPGRYDSVGMGTGILCGMPAFMITNRLCRQGTAV